MEKSMEELMTYASPEEAEVWHRLRRTPAWPAPTGVVEADAALVDRKLAALVRASDWLDARIRWKGDKIAPEQIRAWPRTGLHSAGVPVAVRQACCELAAHFMESDPLAPQERGGRILSESVDSLSVTYAPDAPADPLFPLVCGLLRGLGEPESAGNAAGAVEVGRG